MRLLRSTRNDGGGLSVRILDLALFVQSGARIRSSRLADGRQKSARGYHRRLCLPRSARRVARRAGDGRSSAHSQRNVSAVSRSIPTCSIRSRSPPKALTSNSIKEDTVIQFTADTTGSSQHDHALRSRGAQRGRNDEHARRKDRHVRVSGRSRSSTRTSRSSSGRAAIRSSSISRSSSRSFRIATT